MNNMNGWEKWKIQHTNVSNYNYKYNFLKCLFATKINCYNYNYNYNYNWIATITITITISWSVYLLPKWNSFTRADTKTGSK